MDYEQLKAMKNKTNRFAIYTGINVLEIREGYARAELIIESHHRNGAGNVHGGCQYTLADVTCGSAASSYGFLCSTVSDSFHFLEGAASVEKLIAEARVIRKGRKIVVLEAEVFNADRSVVFSRGTFTYALSSLQVEQELENCKKSTLENGK